MDVQDDFARANELQWGAAEAEALRDLNVSRAEWQGVEGIARIVTILSRRHGLNHCFLPSGGGLTITSASSCEGNAMLVMLMQDTETIVKPVRLTLERFPARQDLSYAVLETEDVDTLKVAPRFSDGEREFVRRIDEYDYVPDDSDDDESRFRGVGTAAVRYFKGGLFVIAPTGGIFNRVDDYQGKANKAGRERLRAWFDRLFKSQLALSHEQPDSSLKRRTRLITSVDDRACAELLLKHISHQLLINLIDADDKLRQERSKEDSQGIIMNFGDERSDRLVKNLLDGKKNPSKKSAQRLVQSMNPSQRAEYMALVQIGRGDAGPQELLRLVELNSKAHFDESYLLEKLGNRYLRRALDRFGLEAPAASNDK